MSRPTPLDHEFDKEKFAELLKIARGNRTQADFANIIPMSPTYLSAFAQLHYDRPLMPNLLYRIAEASEGRVTFEELLETAGYDSQKYKDKKFEPIAIKPEYLEEFKKFNIMGRSNSLRTAIHSALAQSGILFKKQSMEPMGTNLAFTIYEQPFNNWYFIFLGNQDANYKNNPNTLFSYGFQFLKAASVNDKVSFVTEMESDYQEVISQSLPTLKLYVSAILVDIEEYAIIKETYVPTANEIPKNLPVWENIPWNIAEDIRKRYGK